jgi:hypothetical protein
MTDYRVANFKHENQPIVIIYVDGVFESLITMQQQENYAAFVDYAARNGLFGEVALIWTRRDGGMGFYAPPRWKRFMESFSLAQFHANADKIMRI